MKYLVLFSTFGMILFLGFGCTQKNNTEFQTNTTTNDQNQSNSDIKSIDLSKPLTFDKNGYHGTVEAKGYLQVVYSAGACPLSDPDCGTFNYATFVLDETDNLELISLMNSRPGSTFMNKKMIGLGCYKPNQEIYYFNSDKTGTINGFIKGADLTKLEKSSITNLVTLQMIRPVAEKEEKTTDCYSFFRDFKVVNN